MQDGAAKKTPIRNFLTRIPNSVWKAKCKLLCEVVAPLANDPCDSVRDFNFMFSEGVLQASYKCFV